jgi:putative oxidoreductase
MSSTPAHMDAALLLVRVVAGVTMALHGANKVKGGLAGVGGWFESMGMRPGWLHARLAAFTEIGAGLMLALGLLTPFAGAAFVGLMLVAGVTAHRDKGFFIFNEGQGWEYVLVLGTIGAVIGGIGAGDWSVDELIGLDVDGWWGLAVSLGVGLAGGAALLAGFWRPAKVLS